MEWTGKRTDNGEAVKVVVDHGRIRSVQTFAGPESDLPWISAGWIDLQVNGFAGFDFNGG